RPRVRIESQARAVQENRGESPRAGEVRAPGGRGGRGRGVGSRGEGTGRRRRSVRPPRGTGNGAAARPGLRRQRTAAEGPDGRSCAGPGRCERLGLALSTGYACPGAGGHPAAERGEALMSVVRDAVEPFAPVIVESDLWD